MKRPILVDAIVFAAAQLAAPSLAGAAPTTPDAGQPGANVGVVDAFFRTCLAQDVEGARNALIDLGATTIAREPDFASFGLDLGKTPVRIVYASSTLCMLEATVAPEQALGQFAAALKQHDDSEYSVVEDGARDSRGLPVDQGRPSLAGDPPADSVVREHAELRAADGRKTRLLVLSSSAKASEGSIYFIREFASPLEDIGSRAIHPPVFPKAAMKACAHGEVRLRFRIDASGMLTAVTVEDSTGSRQLDEAALEAARQWRFHPGTENGKPIGGELLRSVQFDNPCEGR